MLCLVPANAGQSSAVPEPQPAEPGSCREAPPADLLAKMPPILRRRASLPGNARRPGTRTSGSITAQKSIGNSNYNALEVNSALRSANEPRFWSATPIRNRSIRRRISASKSIHSIASLTRVISSWDMSAQLRRDLQLRSALRSVLRAQPADRRMELSRAPRVSATGFPVTLFDDSDRSLLGTLGNGVNNQLLDTPQIHSRARSRSIRIPRNGQPAFNTSLFAPETLGQLGNAARRFFYGPGIENFDMQLSKTVPISESKSLDFADRSVQCLQPCAVLRPVRRWMAKSTIRNFGHVVSAAAPRLIQVAAKFTSNLKPVTTVWPGPSHSPQISSPNAQSN